MFDIDACTISKRNRSLSRRGEGLSIYRETVRLHPIALHAVSPHGRGKVRPGILSDSTQTTQILGTVFIAFWLRLRCAILCRSRIVI